MTASLSHAATHPTAVVASSPRLTVYAGVGAGAVVASLVMARPALAAFGAPLLLFAVAGVCLARQPSVEVEPPTLTPARAIAGDALELAVGVTARPAAPRLDVRVDLRGPVAVAGRGADAGWCLSDAADELATASVATLEWGRVSVRRATVRAYGPLGLVHWTWTVPASASTRVLPTPERLRTLLDPPPRAAAGSHASRARGSGLDFAELRPLEPGDRLTEVNWRASARQGLIGQGRLMVNVRHPERTGDVVLLLDASADDAEERAPWLPRAGRLAWALARAHLDHHDRVGLVGFGGYTSWVTLGGGERAAYAVLDKLLAIRPRGVTANRTLAWLPPRLLPVDAAVVALTPLHSPATIDILADLRRRGRRVAAVVIDTSDLYPARPTDEAAALARRFWTLELDRRVALLQGAGVIAARWGPGHPLDQAVGLLARISRSSPSAIERGVASP
jgi:uncharacterized protein (DUF58 family)